jgi:hypothetical protein
VPKESAENDFSPMPKSKPVAGADVQAMWTHLLENIQSAPTRALLKQWGAPVKISAEETILTMKNEIFLTQVQSGSKKQSIIQAIDTLFDQSNSNVLIRLPQAGDDAVRQSTVAPVQPTKNIEPKKTVEKEPGPEPEEVDEILEEQVVKRKETEIHSDNVKMVMDLFDGKVID